MASTRYRLGQRVQEDAGLAHSERRVPHERDFPTPSDFGAEERAVYRAAASGYLVLFGEVPALTLDVPRRVELDGLDIELAGRPGIFVDTDHGSEVRMLRIAGTAPHVTEAQQHAGRAARRGRPVASARDHRRPPVARDGGRHHHE